MSQRPSYAVGTGLFIVLGFATLGYLATQTTSVVNTSRGPTYSVEAHFANGSATAVNAAEWQSEMKLHVGDHTFRLVHMPGHTAYQAAVIVEEEGVVFTSDNIFCKVQTWLQEANPEDWLKLRQEREQADIE